MKICKVFNNNVVSSFDEQDREIMVWGKGVGFQKKPNDLIEESKIEKIFRLPSDVTPERKSHFQSLVEEIPYEYMKYTNEIIRMAREGLGRKLNRNIYITLTDHIYYAVERYREKIEVHNAMLFEIKSFYNPEYLIGLRAVDYINEKEKIHLTEDEAAFIALHIVNAELDMTMNQVMNMPAMLSDILSIVRMSYKEQINEASIEYERFVVHIKYMLRRTFEGSVYSQTDRELFDSLCKKEPYAFSISKKIRKYMREKSGMDIPDEEMCYLMVHLSRIQQYGLIKK